MYHALRQQQDIECTISTFGGMPKKTCVQETALLKDFDTSEGQDQLTCCSKLST